MRKKNKNYKLIMIGLFYFIILFVISITYSFFDTNLSHSNKKEQSFKTDQYQISYFIKEKKKSKHSYYYHLIPTLTYLGKAKTTGWKIYLQVPFDTEVTHCYHGSSCHLEGEVLTLSNLPDHGILSPKNNSITMGFELKVNHQQKPFRIIGASFDFSHLPNLEDQPNSNIIKSDDIIPTLQFTGKWDKISTYALKIDNQSSHITLSSWEVQLSYPKESTIHRIWGGDYEYDSSSGKLVISSPKWDSSLSPSHSLEVNIHITPSSSINFPTGTFIGKTITGEIIQKEILIGGNP